ncbi:MAG: hypothetical protein R3E98_16310 [Gemmatimonadota bacterium]
MAKLTVSLDEDRLETADVFTAAQAYVRDRFAAAGEAGEGSSDADDEADEDEEDSEDSEDGEEQDAPITHLGTVTLQRMRELLDDESNWSNDGFRKAIGDFVKPAFLIDGQHRIAAAARFGEKGLPFMVCGLFDPPWEEQVFQFTVVNLKPKRIPPALITSIAGLSLTRGEQDKVEERLARAGVPMAEVTIMSLVAYDGASPFAEKLDMAVGGRNRNPDLLGYGAIKRLAKVWYRASRVSLTTIAKRLYATNSASTARKRWRDDRTWFEFFCAFWSAINGHYPADLWEKSSGSRLMRGAHLWALQEVLLGAADGQVVSVWDVSGEPDEDARKARLMEKLLEVLHQTLPYFPEELWRSAWARSSQDTNAGREELVEFFQEFVTEGKKSGRVWKGWRASTWIQPSADE